MDEEFTYAASGVNIDAADRAVERLQALARRTYRPEVLGGVGGFAALFALDRRYDEPVLVSGCDGVGTKLKVAFMLGRHDSVGIDCVAMCANDVLAQGGEPLFFLDYLAVGAVDPEQVESIGRGLVEGRQAGCALIGGETAEMPGFYAAGEYDLAGFVVGVAERRALPDYRAIVPGDRLIGLASSGLHANGYSLARRVLLDYGRLPLDAAPPGLGAPLGEELLRPTRIYVRALRPLRRERLVKAAAHITGGGLPGNLPRILPDGTAVRLRRGWEIPAIFKLIQETGGVAGSEMWRTFNMGIGMALVVAAGQAERVIEQLRNEGETAWEIGEVIASPHRGQILTFDITPEYDN